MQGEGQTALSLHDIACVRGDQLLFEGLDLALGAGEAALVKGPNGAGKSSLLRIAAGLLAPAAGEMRREGRVALAAEATALDLALPLGRALHFWAALDGGGMAEVEAAAAAMGIAALLGVPVRMLSTGQRKRAVLARVIASGAGLWLLDEPGNGLDAAALDALGAAITGHRAGGGIAIVATHQPIALGEALEVRL